MGYLSVLSLPALAQGACFDGVQSVVAGHLDNLASRFVISSGAVALGGGLTGGVACGEVPVGFVEPSGFDDDADGFDGKVCNSMCRDRVSSTATPLFSTSGSMEIRVSGLCVIAFIGFCF